MLALAGVAVAGGCARNVSNPAPPRIDEATTLPAQSSIIVVPVTADLDQLAAGINRSAPRQLWRIDERKPDCLPAQRVKIGIGKLKIGKVKVLPDIGCRIVGQVTRGTISLSGRGDTLIVTFPVHAAISAQDVGGIIKNKTATGSAVVRAVARLSIARDWSPRASVAIAYDWKDPPGIDFLGKRITFASKADAKLKGVIAGLERSLPGELAKLRLRQRLAAVWSRAFTTIELNRDKPPAWLRVTPRQLGFGGYRIAGRQLSMLLSGEALTETFVGNRPADPVATPLPPPTRTAGTPGLRFFVPVVADYAQLELVIQRTLRKIAARGITLRGVGPVDAEFGKVTVYATTGGHIAIGVEAKARARASTLTTTKGEIWLSALPYNDPGSQVVRARDVQLAGTTDSGIVNVLFALFNDARVQEGVRRSLTHDFAPDYQRVLAAARKAIGQRREGDFILSVDVTDVANGRIRVTGGGLFMPVRAEGKATIAYRPLRRLRSPSTPR
ncbi:DUF4403 family protein [uncultured Sphingomonas sp.]|uniref:DUF4403 family protein n=1 Tax=uncultured Sphingomonas sp. TaxID=158754 RepID=UPI0035CC15C9